MPRPASLENWDHLAMTLLLGTPFESAGELEAFRGSDGGVVLDSPHLRFANPRDIRCQRRSKIDPPLPIES